MNKKTVLAKFKFGIIGISKLEKQMTPPIFENENPDSKFSCGLDSANRHYRNPSKYNFWNHVQRLT